MTTTDVDPTPDLTVEKVTGAQIIGDLEPSMARHAGAGIGDAAGDVDPAGQAADTAAPAGVPAPLVFVDPRELLVDVNVRTEVKLDKQFVGSIKDLGVLVPVTARRVDGEQLRVLTGHRRVLGAIEAGRMQVPVYLVEAPDEETAAEIARIIEQLTENDHRDELGVADRVRAHQQLALLGLSAGQIARRTRTGTTAVKTSLAVAGSQPALGALDRFDLTLAQAAVLAEFDGDTEAVAALTAAAAKDSDQFDHIAQRLRDAHAEAATREALTAQLTTAGLTLVEPPGHGERRVRRLDRLKASLDDPSTGELSVEAHAGCPGHAAYLDDRGSYSGPPEIVPVYVCTDPARHGHADRHAAILTTGRPGGPMSEEQKAERREVIANNKAWDSAQTVRRDWLTTFLARKSPPKDAQQFIATTLATAGHEVRGGMTEDHAMALQLLGLGEWRAFGGRPHPVVAATAKASPNRAAMLTLGLLLGGLEQSLGRHTWRGASRAAVAYLTTLSRWGYPLSDVEQRAVASGSDRNLSVDANPDDEAEQTTDPHGGDDGSAAVLDSPQETDADPGDPADADDTGADADPRVDAAPDTATAAA